MLRGAVAQLRRNARGLAARGDPPRRRRGLATRTAAPLRPRHRGLSTKKQRDPAVAHAQREAVRRNWNPFAFDVSLNSPYLWGAAACVALVATAWDEAETDEQRRRREEAERRKKVAESLAALRRKE